MNELKTKLNAYTVKVTPVAPEDGGGFKAIYQELALSVKGYGSTLSEAVSDLEDVAFDVLEDESIADMQAPRQRAMGRPQRTGYPSTPQNASCTTGSISRGTGGEPQSTHDACIAVGRNDVARWS